jgi:hypothetical protein
MTTFEGDERRELFRITDRLLVEYRHVTYEESISLERNLRQSFSFHDSTYHHLSELPIGPPFLRDLYSYLEVMDRKLNMILEALSKKDELFRSRYLDVDISGTGVRFMLDDKLGEGGLLELCLVLPCFPDARIRALGRIVRVWQDSSGDDGSWETAVSFVAMNEKDKDILIGYIFSKERERLRAKQ